jgi:hypothetical protein
VLDNLAVLCKQGVGGSSPLSSTRANSRTKITCEAVVPLTCPLHSPYSPLPGRSGSPARPGKLADDVGDRALPVVGVVQVGQRGPGAGMTHARHQMFKPLDGSRPCPGYVADQLNGHAARPTA